jgi:hypothetical protein
MDLFHRQLELPRFQVVISQYHIASTALGVAIAGKKNILDSDVWQDKITEVL